MALPTSSTPNPPPRQSPTPGVGTHLGAPDDYADGLPPASTAGVGTVPLAGQGMLPGTEAGMTPIAPLGPLQPKLVPGLDPVLLMRLYPEHQNVDAARAQALAEGEATARAGAEMVPSQNEPVPELDEAGAPIWRRDDREGRDRNRPPQGSQMPAPPPRRPPEAGQLPGQSPGPDWTQPRPPQAGQLPSMPERRDPPPPSSQLPAQPPQAQPRPGEQQPWPYRPPGSPPGE